MRFMPLSELVLSRKSAQNSAENAQKRLKSPNPLGLVRAGSLCWNGGNCGSGKSSRLYKWLA